MITVSPSPVAVTVPEMPFGITVHTSSFSTSHSISEYFDEGRFTAEMFTFEVFPVPLRLITFCAVVKYTSGS